VQQMLVSLGRKRRHLHLHHQVAAPVCGSRKNFLDNKLQLQLQQLELQLGKKKNCCTR
jgi:hypothetical protein